MSPTATHGAPYRDVFPEPRVSHTVEGRRRRAMSATARGRCCTATRPRAIMPCAIQGRGSSAGRRPRGSTGSGAPTSPSSTVAEVNLGELVDPNWCPDQEELFAEDVTRPYDDVDGLEQSGDRRPPVRLSGRPRPVARPGSRPGASTTTTPWSIGQSAARPVRPRRGLAALRPRSRRTGVSRVRTKPGDRCYRLLELNYLADAIDHLRQSAALNLPARFAASAW